MAIAINGNGTITGIVAGGLPDGIIVNADVKSDAVIATSKLSGAVTGITSHGLPTFGAVASLADISNANVNTSAGIAWSKLAADSLDTTVTRVNLKDYGETTNAIGPTGGGTQDIDLTLGNSVTATIDAATTFTFSNPTAGDEGCGFTLVLTNGAAYTVTWPAGSILHWAGGTAPTLTASGVDILTFWTINGGTLWHGFAASIDSKSP